MRVLRTALPVLAIPLALAAWSHSVAAQFGLREPSDVPQIIAAATAHVPLSADRAVIFISLAGRDSAGIQAVRDVAAARARVAAALRPLGYGADAIVPWAFAFGAPTLPMMGPPPAPASRESSERMARQGIRLVVDRLDQLDAVLGAIAGAEIDGVPYVQFQATRTTDARLRALEAAVADARQQAETMARAAGGRLGPLMSVVTMPDFAQGMSGADRFLSFPPGMDRGTQLIANDVGIRVTVQAAWRFEAR